MKRFLTYLLILIGITVSSSGFSAVQEGILNGRILEVNRKFDFVIINLGAEDGVEQGMVFMVYRDKKLLGKVVVEEVFPQMSSCVILPDWKLGDVKVDDGVLKP